VICIGFYVLCLDLNVNLSFHSFCVYDNVCLCECIFKKKTIIALGYLHQGWEQCKSWVFNVRTRKGR
jgi:hypothetical protein